MKWIFFICSTGSKDETFFETQQWLQSDSDDDFHSVNGGKNLDLFFSLLFYNWHNFFYFSIFIFSVLYSDFTPSRGNTPKCSFSDRPPRIQSLRFQDKKSSRGSSPAPRPRRKKLGELFRDSIRERPEESSAASSTLSSPYLSVANSGEVSKAAIEDAGVKEQKKSNRQHHRCLPSFSSCGGSFMERRKKLSSETAVDAVKWDVENNNITFCIWKDEKQISE